MKNKSKTVVFFGNEQLATGTNTDMPVLCELLKNGYDIEKIISPFSPSTSRKKISADIESFANQNSIPFVNPHNTKEILEAIANTNASVGVLVAFGMIVSQEVIDSFPMGIVNIHPSLLPKHRGPTPIESVILSGEKRTGVSLMALDKQMDAGGVYAQSEVILTGSESKQQIADELSVLGATMLIELLPEIVNGDIIAKPQDDSLATYGTKIAKKNGIIDWSEPADVIERKIRAFSGWPKSHTILSGIDVNIIDAEVVDQSGKPGDYKITKTELVVYCGNNALSIKHLQPAGKKEMPIQAFLAGYKI